MPPRGFSDTQPSSSLAGQRSDVRTSSGEALELALAGIIGSQLSEPLAAMQHVLRQLEQTSNCTSSQVRLLKASIDAASIIAKQSQQISRLASGRLRQAHERLRLDVVLRRHLHERADAFQRHGVELYTSLKSVEVIVDASLLNSLLDAALDWSVSMGQRLVITLEVKNWPENGLLFIRTSQSVATAASQADSMDGQTLGWYLLSETGHAMGVSVEKVAMDQELNLLIEFPRTVKRMEGMTAIELDTGFDSLNSESKPLAGHRVLVITNDEAMRVEVLNICRRMGLAVDFCPSTAQGMRFCELDRPHMVVVDQRVKDHVFEELRTDLRNTHPNYPFIEIASESNTLEVAGWMSDSMTRLSRDSLRSQLPSILALELSKVM